MALEELKSNQFKVFAIEQAEQSLMLNEFIVEANTKVAFVLGNEINGVAQEVVDACNGVIEIPQGGFKHSLNISIAAGIVSWEVYRQLL
jgi:tRNA G18 (ribose-2'-O)-methylase SpoU